MPLEGWIVFATVVAAFAGLIAAFAAVWLALQNRQLVRDSAAQVNASLDQVQASRDQAREANIARYNSQLPILAPGDGFQGITPPLHPSDPSYEVQGQSSGYRDSMRIRNVGPGAAFNVWCCAYAVLGSESQPVYTMGGLLSIPEVIASGSSTGLYGMVEVTYIPATTILEVSDMHKRVSLAPDSGTGYRVRVTITCLDVFGRKHASIHDFVIGGNRRDAWRFAAQLSDISEDIGDLQARYPPPPPPATTTEQSDGQSSS